MKHTLLPLLFFAFHFNAFAQCDEYIVSGNQVFHANDIRTIINAGGDMFWDLNDARFQVPFRSSHAPSAIFAAAVWMGAYDDVGNLKIAAQTYRQNVTSRQEYMPGPLTPLGIPFDPVCEHWDRIWSVTSEEVYKHLADYEDNGLIDRPNASIFGWPGRGNMFFEEINGFTMPDYPTFGAPFYDIDGDGIYEPQDGEYPAKISASTHNIPDQITWNVFHDVRPHNVSHGDPLRIEVQQTSYAMYCPGGSELNNTLFMDFKLTNRGTSVLDSIYFGLWADPDLGCYLDDYIGCSPDQSSMFVYNKDDFDGPDCNGVIPYVQGPPSMAVSFVDRQMSSFIAYAGVDLGGVPPEITGPQIPLEYFRMLSGSWRDGSPICFGGSGYNPGPGCVPTRYTYPGDPNDGASWSMLNVDPPFTDARGIMATYISRLDPGDNAMVSMAFALHLDPSRDNLGNVTLMYEEVDKIREDFADGFTGCERVMEPCSIDCVWPGDANNDGIANHLDLLELGVAFGKDGPQRMAPLSWAPHRAEDWDDDFMNGQNVKYADMNGDGTIDYSLDPDILNVHYGSTHDDYQRLFACMDGDGIQLEGGFSLLNPTNFHTRTEITLNTNVVHNLNGLAFTVQYDTAYFKMPVVATTKSPFAAFSNVLITHYDPGIIEYASVRIDGVNEFLTEDKSLMVFLFSIKNKDIIPGQNDTTQVCVGNIRAVLSDGTEIPLGSNTIEFVFLEPTTALPEDLSEQAVSIYPNPTTGHITLEVADDLVGTTYQVLDAIGREILVGRITSAYEELQLAPGMSLLVISSDAGRVVKKIVVLE